MHVISCGRADLQEDCAAVDTVSEVETMKFVVEERELAELLHMLPPGSWDSKRSSLGQRTMISLVTPDSRECGPGTMFVAISGTRLDGASYIASALCAGAACIVAETEHPEVQDVPVVVVSSCREFLSLVSQAFFNFPARRMKMVGITGTSGKTSTAYMIRRLLQGLDIACVMIGTTGYVMPDGEFFPPDALPATTPEAFTLNWYLDHAVHLGAQVAVLEVSSFALTFGRVHGMRFDCGVFTNFSQDHMGYHGTMDAYLAAKLRLFTSLDENSVAILNTDDPSFASFRDAAGARRSGRFPWSEQLTCVVITSCLQWEEPRFRSLRATEPRLTWSFRSGQRYRRPTVWRRSVRSMPLNRPAT